MTEGASECGNTDWEDDDFQDGQQCVWHVSYRGPQEECFPVMDENAMTGELSVSSRDRVFSDGAFPPSVASHTNSARCPPERRASLALPLISAKRSSVVAQPSVTRGSTVAMYRDAIQHRQHPLEISPRDSEDSELASDRGAANLSVQGVLTAPCPPKRSSVLPPSPKRPAPARIAELAVALYTPENVERVSAVLRQQHSLLHPWQGLCALRKELVDTSQLSTTPLPELVSRVMASPHPTLPVPQALPEQSPPRSPTGSPTLTSQKRAAMIDIGGRRMLSPTTTSSTPQRPDRPPLSKRDLKRLRRKLQFRNF
eukprot:RCo029716